MSDHLTPNAGLAGVPPTPMGPPAVFEKVHLPITIGDSIHVPGWVVDQESFRRWARSDEYPRTGKIRLVEGAKQGFVESEGAADMVLEVISEGSVKKDTEILRDLYWPGGVLEFWLVDARGQEPVFTVLGHASEGYQQADVRDGWQFSRIYDRWFQLQMDKNQAGLPSYSLNTRASI